MNGDVTKGRAFVKRLYFPRIIGLGLGFFCVASVFYQQGIHTLAWLGLIANGFLWPHLAYFTARNSPRPYQAEMRNLLIDSFLGGIWVPLMAFNALPSVTVLFMLSMDNIATGGIRLFVKGLAAQLAGAMLAILFFGFHVRIESTMLNILACLPMLAVYPLSIGMITYCLSKAQSRQRKEIEKINSEIKEANDKLTEAYGRMRESRDHLIKHHGQEEIGFIVDRKGKIEGITERALECTGKSRAELIGHNLLEFLDESYHGEFKNELRLAWMGASRNFLVPLMQSCEPGKLFEAKLTRLTSESRRSLLVVLI